MKKTSAASLGSLGGLSPNISSYIQSLWGRTSAGFRHRQQRSKDADCWGAAKKSLHEGIHEHTCCQVAGEPRGLLQSWRERSGWGSSFSWLQQERERHLPLPSVVNKLIFTTPCRNFAPSITFRSSKRHSKGPKKFRNIYITTGTDERLLLPGFRTPFCLLTHEELYTIRSPWVFAFS